MTKNEFKKIVEKGRKIYIKADENTQELFNRIEGDFGIKEAVLQDMPTNAPNADNVEEAICCYMQYGEYDIDSLWEDLMKGYVAHQ